MEAAGSGHLHIIRWLKEKGCPWEPLDVSTDAYVAAAEKGHLHVMRWLYENGFPWKEGYAQQYMSVAEKELGWAQSQHPRFWGPKAEAERAMVNLDTNFANHKRKRK